MEVKRYLTVGWVDILFLDGFILCALVLVFCLLICVCTVFVPGACRAPAGWVYCGCKTSYCNFISSRNEEGFLFTIVASYEGVIISNFMVFVCLFIVEAVGGKALPCVVDVRDEQQINNAVEKAVEKFGGIPLILK